MEIKTIHIHGICKVKAKDVISKINTRSMNVQDDTLEIDIDGHRVIIEHDMDPCGNVCAVTVDNKTLCGRQEGQFWTYWPATIINGILIVRLEHSGIKVSIDEECMIWIESYDTLAPYTPSQPRVTPPWE